MGDELYIEGSRIGSSSCTRLARYLTKKGANVDSSIQWINAGPESSRKRTLEFVSHDASSNDPQYHNEISENQINQQIPRQFKANPFGI